MHMPDQYRAAFQRHRIAAECAAALFTSYCAARMSRVPGMDTVIRLAWRIECGRSVEEAAAHEYLYRWNLAIKTPDQVIGAGTRNNASSVFGAPHPIGL
jgi:hypothetical protein